MVRAVLAVSLAALACTPLNRFTPTTTETYPARADDYPIAVLTDAPARPHVVLGYIEARGTTLDGAMPLLLKQARMAGGDAILKIDVSHVSGLAQAYMAQVIRYTDGDQR